MVSEWPPPLLSSITIRRCMTANAGRSGTAVVTLAAEGHNGPCGSITAQVLPGRVASVTPPQTSDSGDRGETARNLVIQLNAELHAEGVQLAQSLLAPEDLEGAKALRVGGYEHASDLLYMAAEAASFPDQSLALPFDLVPITTNDHARLERIVDATYVGTLDCPRIDGLRATADVIAGYRAVGESGDRLWRIVHAENEDVGCLLLADHSSTRQYEVVYVGLKPEVRGRGWGLELTRHAQWIARQADCKRLVLAVDAANEPAIRIYAAAGFRAWDRQAVWIKSFRESPTSSPATT